MKHFYCSYDYQDSGDAENGPGKLEPQDGFPFDAENASEAEKFIKDIYFKDSNTMFEIVEISDEEYKKIKEEESL